MLRRLELRIDEAERERPSLNACEVDSGAVVGDRYHHAVAFCGGTQVNLADWRLSAFAALRRRLDTVVDTVSHEMHERLTDRIDERLVKVCIAALDDQLYVFADGFRQIAYQSRKGLEDARDPTPSVRASRLPEDQSWFDSGCLSRRPGRR